MRLSVSDPSLVILCGPAGSGKSSFAGRHFPPTAIVSSDACRAMISDDPSNMAVSAGAFALFHQIIQERLRHRKLTVADSTALQADARRTLRRLGRRAGLPVIVVVFDVPEETCVRWDLQRQDRRVGAGVIHRQWLRFRQTRLQIDRETYAQVIVLGEDEIASARVEIAKSPARRAGVQR